MFDLLLDILDVLVITSLFTLILYRLMRFILLELFE
jgi:hypothetical protein